MQGILSLEKKINFRQGKGGPSKSVLQISDGTNPQDVDKICQTQADDHPHLVVFTLDKKRIENVELVADECTIHVEEAGIVESLLLLCVSYYVFDLAFPRKYSQLLGLVQHTVIGENYTGKRTTAFNDLISGVHVANNSNVSVDESGANKVAKKRIRLSVEDKSVNSLEIEDVSSRDPLIEVGSNRKGSNTKEFVRGRQQGHNDRVKSQAPVATKKKRKNVRAESDSEGSDVEFSEKKKSHRNEVCDKASDTNAVSDESDDSESVRGGKEKRRRKPKIMHDA